MHGAQIVIGPMRARADEVCGRRPCSECHNGCSDHHEEVYGQPRGSQADENGPQPRHVEFSLVPSQVSVKETRSFATGAPGDGESRRAVPPASEP
jgi:hypothetical protein